MKHPSNVLMKKKQPSGKNTPQERLEAFENVHEEHVEEISGLW